MHGKRTRSELRCSTGRRAGRHKATPNLRFDFWTALQRAFHPRRQSLCQVVPARDMIHDTGRAKWDSRRPHAARQQARPSARPT